MSVDELDFECVETRQILDWAAWMVFMFRRVAFMIFLFFFRLVYVRCIAFSSGVWGWAFCYIFLRRTTKLIKEFMYTFHFYRTMYLVSLKFKIDVTFRISDCL